ncbi:MFS transporter [Mangrovactinospora gilvigrisea]|uniref:MFS transporter n=1 Tax=Mangrovactinospora gilvigrisea TaxID=1428644 RepID=A0A1J7BAX3_9ACTN|nr:MFS transporter [Mangrovactinospora gilvigrisea]
MLTTERPRPEAVRSRPGAWALAVGTVCFGAFMGQLDASIVTLTYGSLRTEFHTSLAAVQWVSLAYLLTLVALLIPVGRLSDAHGRKLLYLYGFVLFTAASAACGFAPTLGLLVVFRAVQAVGAAMLQANSVALVTTSAPRARMRTALGIQAAGQALGLALGPTIGGAMVATIGWRWVFWINVPIGIVAVVAGHYLLPRTRHRNAGSGFDWAGLALLTVATTALLLGISAASGLSLPAWSVVALFAVAVAAGWGFVRRQGRARDPLLSLRLLRVRSVSSGLVGALCAYLALFGPLVLVPQVLRAHGDGALAAGVMLTALPAGFAVAATLADRVLPRGLSDRARCTAGGVVVAAALVGLLLTPAVPGVLVPLLGVLGLGLGLFMPSNNALVMASIPTEFAGTGGGLVNMARGLGTALGVALVTLGMHLGGNAGAWGVLVAAGVLALLSGLGGAGGVRRSGTGRPIRGTVRETDGPLG